MAKTTSIGPSIAALVSLELVSEGGLPHSRSRFVKINKLRRARRERKTGKCDSFVSMVVVDKWLVVITPRPQMATKKTGLVDCESGPNCGDEWGDSAKPKRTQRDQSWTALSLARRAPLEP